jgi:divalent metal cation (Fe/Co/Zn/Cd) transporter
MDFVFWARRRQSIAKWMIKKKTSRITIDFLAADVTGKAAERTRDLKRINIKESNMERLGQYDARVQTLQRLTVAWMCVELVAAAIAGVRAHSVALVAFAGDSAVELLSAVVVLQRFRLGPGSERTAAKVNAVLLYVLAVYILLNSSLSLFGHFQPRPSAFGIVLLIASAVVRPWLGAAKKRLAVETDSGALKADAAQSNICAYMSWIALVGLFMNAVFHIPWADSVAALLLLPLVLYEANEALKGKKCNC